MPHVLDLHFHSMHSDGNGWPREIVAAARGVHPGVTHLALTDHNTFSGCVEFIESCGREGIQGFASLEIATHLPELDVDVEFLTYLGTSWNDAVARRADRLTPYLNEIHRVDTANLFTLLQGANAMGMAISIRDVNATLMRHYESQTEPRDPCAVRPVTLWDLMKVLNDTPAPGNGSVTVEDVWKYLGKTPIPQPSSEGLFAIYREIRPAVILAHPNHYGIPPEAISPLVEKWRATFNLVAIECWNRGKFLPEWKQFADDRGLLASAGSDAHNTLRKWNLPVLDDDAADIPGLLRVLTAD